MEKEFKKFDEFQVGDRLWFRYICHCRVVAKSKNHLVIEKEGALPPNEDPYLVLTRADCEFDLFRTNA